MAASYERPVASFSATQAERHEFTSGIKGMHSCGNANDVHAQSWGLPRGARSMVGNYCSSDAYSQSLLHTRGHASMSYAHPVRS